MGVQVLIKSALQASIYSYQWQARKAGIAQAFHSSASKSLGQAPMVVEALERAYGINSQVPDETALRNIVKFASDIGFYTPVIQIASNWPGPAYVYHFNQPNPWKGPWEGEASHILDIAFLFQNFNEFLSDGQRALARQFAEHVLDFVNGEDPFPSRQAKPRGAMVYGTPPDEASFVESSLPSDFGRRETVAHLAESVGFDALKNILQTFNAGQ